MKGNGKSDLIFGGNATSMIVDEKGNDAALKEAAKYHNKVIDGYTQAMKSKMKSEEEMAKKVTEQMETMEIVPYGSNVLLKPYSANPFDKVEVTKSGIYIPTMEGTHSFKNPDTGEMDQEECISRQAQVIEVGPDCKYVREGDVVYYRKGGGMPVPFFRQGLECINENQIQVIVNEGLKERFKLIKGK